MGIWFTQKCFDWHLPIKGLIRSTIFQQFCGGETLEEANETSKRLSQYGISVIMDYGVEGKSNEDEFEKTTATFLHTIEFSKDKPFIPFISMKITGFARFELLEKIHSWHNHLVARNKKKRITFQRVDKICKAASIHKKMILIDAEESWIQQPVDDFADAMMAKYNKNEVIVFNTFRTLSS